MSKSQRQNTHIRDEKAKHTLPEQDKLQAQAPKESISQSEQAPTLEQVQAPVKESFYDQELFTDDEQISDEKSVLLSEWGPVDELSLISIFEPSTQY